MINLNTAAVQDRSDFVNKVYTTLGVSLLFCCTGAYFGLSMPPSLYIPIVILEFVFLIACMILQRSFPLNLLLLTLFVITSGLTLGPILSKYITYGEGAIIPLALGSTSIIFGVLSVYVHISKKDFSFLGGFLFVGLLGMIIVGLAGMFFNFSFNTTLYAAIGVIIFSGYILFDTSNMLHRYRDEEYVAATIALYLSFLNLFLLMLQLLSGKRR